MNVARTLFALAVAIVASGAVAQTYPSKPVRLIVPFTPGSGTDVMARAVSPKLSELLGHQVLVENRPGAGGSIGAAAVAKSPPDGHTLLWHSNAFVTNPTLQPTSSYDPLKDFVAISALVSTPLVLVISPSAGARSVSDLIALAKARPGVITYGSAGTGTGTHFGAEKFRLAARIEAVHVPYKGGPEPMADVMAGRITYWFPPVSIAVPHIRDGKLLALAVTSAQRVRTLPDVPTIAEAALPGFSYLVWWGLWAAAGTSREIAAKLASAVDGALAAPELRERLAQLGAEPMAMTPAAFARFVQDEMADAARLVKLAAIKLE